MLKALVITFIIITGVFITSSFIDRKYDYVVETDRVIGYTFTPYPNSSGCAVYYTRNGETKGTICGNFSVTKIKYNRTKVGDFDDEE